MKNVILATFLLFASLYAEFPIECIGTTEITFMDTKTQKTHSLTCFEPLEIDFDNCYLQSLSINPNRKQQVHFQDEEYDLYADNLIAHYHFDKGHFKIDTLKLYENVFLIQKDINLQNKIEHYVLADQLDYYGENEIIFLKSKENSRVLYYDQLNQYQIAANEVIIKKNPQSEKFLVEGVGVVHLTFKEDEIQKLKNRLLQNQKGS